MAGFGAFGAGARASSATMLGAFQNPGVTFAPSREAVAALDDTTRGGGTAPAPPDGSSGPWPYVIGGAMMIVGVGFFAATLAINGRAPSRSASR